MKVKVEFTIDATDDQREAINRYYGKPGLATRQEVKDYFQMYGDVNGMEQLGDVFEQMSGDKG